MDRKRCDRSLGSKEEGVETARVFREEVPFLWVWLTRVKSLVVGIQE